MTHKHHALRSALIVALLPAIVGKVIGSAEPALMERTLEAIRDWMVRSPAPWPDAWQRQYVDTIRSAIESHQDTPQYALRLEILYKGFQPYWEDLKKTLDRSLFEVHRAQIRWYAEHLMGTELPCQEEKQKLRDQYQDLWSYAASSLLTQFPFLDPNIVQMAKADDLGECYRKIEAPLLPNFLRPFSQGQVEQIKQRWHDLRYARVDLWHQLGGAATTSGDNGPSPSLDAHSDYLLTQRSLAQLRAHIWSIVAPAPDYYRRAVGNHIEAQKRRLQSTSQAWQEERRLEKERSRQLLQTEYISFLLPALLETPESLQGSLSIRAQEETQLEHQDGTGKGGDAYEYELENVSPEQ